MENVAITSEEQREEVANDLEVITSDPDEIKSEDVTSTVDVLEEVVDTDSLTTNVFLLYYFHPHNVRLVALL